MFHLLGVFNYPLVNIYNSQLFTVTLLFSLLLYFVPPCKVYIGPHVPEVSLGSKIEGVKSTTNVISAQCCALGNKGTVYRKLLLRGTLIPNNP